MFTVWQVIQSELKGRRKWKQDHSLSRHKLRNVYNYECYMLCLCYNVLQILTFFLGITKVSHCLPRFYNCCSDLWTAFFFPLLFWIYFQRQSNFCVCTCSSIKSLINSGVICMMLTDNHDGLRVVISFISWYVFYHWNIYFGEIHFPFEKKLQNCCLHFIRGRCKSRLPSKK